MQKGVRVDKPEGVFYVKGIMFVVDDILVSDDLADERFSCHLGVCQGACCVHGDSGAPLDEGELSTVESLVPAVRRYLSGKALDVIDTNGPWEKTSEGGYATRCVDNRECVFVTYEGAVAKCAIHKAHMAGRTDFMKPVSCHLFPVRADSYGAYDVLNYERVGICDSGRLAGAKNGVLLAEFLRLPLVRKYGEVWYNRFRTACEERREVLAG